jgi:hypothetical protein
MTTQLGNRRRCVLAWLLVLLLTVPPWAMAQETDTGTGAAKAFTQEELDQMLAPVALYPDSLLSQVMMASTYPLEVVEADRWAQKNKNLEGDALARELEKENWDPSVKSLVQFPDVLAMMSEQLDWTQKMGDAFLEQQEDVMNTVQKLRQKAEDAGNLKTTQEQVVKVEKEVIIIESANPQVIYVPVYNPTVVYGTWWWPHYPPYYYYPPYYPRPTLYGFGAGVAVGVAWGYAWGHWNWHGHSININVNRNINLNKNINRDRYRDYSGRNGKWEHRPEHRKGVSYHDNKTAQKYNRAASQDAVKAREDFRGKADAGRKDLDRGSAEQYKSRDTRPVTGPETKDRMQSRETVQKRDTVQSRDMAKSRENTQKRNASQAKDLNRGGAFTGMNNGSASRNYSQRGSMSRSGGGTGGRGGGGRGRR